MSGLITKKEVLENSDFIIDKYGFCFFCVCMKSEGKTFLGLLIEFGKI